MQNKSYYYTIGGLNLYLETPLFSEKETLSVFKSVFSKADIEYRTEITDSIDVSHGSLVYCDAYRKYVKSEKDFISLFENEKDGDVFLSTILSDGICSVYLKEDKAGLLDNHLILEIMDIPRQIINFGGIFLHASYVVHNGEAILFTAPKQTGKSTQAALWEKYRGAEIVNGDRTLIRKVDNMWYAFGSPYCGTSKICKNITAPIKAIVILTQSDENKARKASTREAFASLLDGCTYDTWNREQATKAMDIMQGIITSIPFYKLECTPDERAVEALEAVL